MPRRAVTVVLALLLASAVGCTTPAPIGHRVDEPRPDATAVPPSAMPGDTRQAAAAAQCSGLGFSPGPDDTARAAALMAGRVAMPPHAETPLAPDLTWTEDPFGDANWRFQLHTLRWADVLRREGARTGDSAMPARHRAILRDWLRDNPRDAPASRASWTDMAAGLRAIALSCAISTYGPQRWLLDALAAHGAVLSDPAFGSQAGNHALHVRNGLLIAGCVGERQDWIDAARTRIAALLRRSVDSEGVIDEGSVMYQQANYSWYSESQRRLENCGVRPHAVFERVARMPAFLAHATDPDGRLVQLGDTDRAVAARNGVDGTALYAATRGRSGTRPTTTYRTYARGYVFGRSGWGETRPFADELYYTLRFGPPLRTQGHGHEDAGALTLHAYRRQLLFDSGRYTYNLSAMRTYTDSRRAHNTVDVIGVPYRDDVPTELLVTRHTPSYDLTTVRVTALAGSVWKRTVFYSHRGGYLVVDDRIVNSAPLRMVQRWNLPENLPIRVLGTSLETGGRGAGVSLRWIVSSPRLSVTTGQQNPLLGWRSYTYGTVFPAPVAEARLSGNTGRFTTLVFPRPGPGQVTVTDAAVSANLVRMTVTAGAVTERIRLSPTSAHVEPG